MSKTGDLYLDWIAMAKINTQAIEESKINKIKQENKLITPENKKEIIRKWMKENSATIKK